MATFNNGTYLYSVTPGESYTYNTSTGSNTVTYDGSKYIIRASDGTSNTMDPNVFNDLVASGTISLSEPLSEEEKKKLKLLKEEKQAWIKQQKLNEFKNLPSHIRQRVVDEICISECIERIENIDGSGFDSQSEIDKLEQKEHNANIFSSSTFISAATTVNSLGVTLADGSWYIKSFTNKLTEIFTKEELMEAHTAATLEENLADE